MSIKPIDHNVMIPKTQEVSSNKHIENMKNRNIVDSGFIQQEKKITKDKSRVRDTEKSSNAKINDQGSNKGNQESKKNKSNKTNKELTDETISIDKGNTIDIRI